MKTILIALALATVLPQVVVAQTPERTQAVLAPDSASTRQLPCFRAVLNDGKVIEGKQGRLTASGLEGVIGDSQSISISITNLKTVAVGVQPNHFRAAAIGTGVGAGIGALLSAAVISLAISNHEKDKAEAENQGMILASEFNWGRAWTIAEIITGGCAVLGAGGNLYDSYQPYSRWKDIPLHVALIPSLDGAICQIELPLR